MAVNRRRARWILAAAALALILAAYGAVQILRTPRVANRLCSAGVKLLGRQLGLAASVEACRIDPLSARVRISGIHASDPASPERSVEIASVDLRLNPLRALASGLWI
ncbi:MAG TPA: hypothetical protein VMB50_09310, partial [Myxococcales bacterium]|nr:hypothetical protein [Myxococcales bacterium]